MNDRQRQIGVIVLIAGHGLFAFFLPWMARAAGRESEPAMALLFGLGIGQVTLLSLWAAIGPGRFVERIPALVFLVALFWYLLLLGNRLLAWRLPMSVSLFLGILVFGEYAFLQLPFWLVRGTLGWRIERCHPAGSREPMGETQFGLGRVLAWTTGAAALLAMGRWLLPRTEELVLPYEVYTPEFYVFCFAVSVFNVTFALPAVWIAFRAVWAFPVWVILLFMCCGCVSAMECAILSAIEDSMPPELIMCVNGGLFTCVFATLAAMRPLGYRMSSATWPRPAPRAVVIKRSRPPKIELPAELQDPPGESSDQP